MNKIGQTLTNHPKKILLAIFLLTVGLFYYAFLSDHRLIIDFSLEQMFPENDPEKEIYDNKTNDLSIYLEPESETESDDDYESDDDSEGDESESDDEEMEDSKTYDFSLQPDVDNY